MDEFGRTFFHNMVRQQPVEDIKKLISKLPSDAAKQLLQSREPSVLHTAVFHKDNDQADVILAYLLDCMKEHIQPEELETVICDESENGDTVLHDAARRLSATQLKNVLGLIDPSTACTLIQLRDRSGRTALHCAMYNDTHPQAIKPLLQVLVGNLSPNDLSDVLLCLDSRKKTFLHYLHPHKKEQVETIVGVLPRPNMMALLSIKDYDGKTPRDLYDIEREMKLAEEKIQSHSKSNPDGYYLLKTPPHVLVLYSTNGRMSGEQNQETSFDAETEKDHVEEFFKDRNFPVEVVKDPSADEVFASIKKYDREDVEALMVFMMSHGHEGVLSVSGSPEYVLVEEVISAISQSTRDKPKALILQACQSNPQLTSGISGNLDPVPIGSSLAQAVSEGVSLKEKDFLLYMATVSGGYALRNLMIPCFIEQLTRSSPDECLSNVCTRANRQVQDKLRELDPQLRSGQISKQESTLTKKFALMNHLSIRT